MAHNVGELYDVAGLEPKLNACPPKVSVGGSEANDFGDLPGRPMYPSVVKKRNYKLNRTPAMTYALC
jgi:hypothetical protein